MYTVVFPAFGDAGILNLSKKTTQYLPWVDFGGSVRNVIPSVS